MIDGAVQGARLVAVLRALPGLGDLLCAVPALRSLRAGLPAAHVALVGVPTARWFVERFAAYVDELLVLPSFPGLPEVGADPRRAVAFCAQAQARQFDLALQLQGNGFVTNTLAALLGARVTAASTLPGRWAPDLDHSTCYASDGHEIERLLAVVRQLGMPDTGTHLEFPALPRDRRDHSALLDAGRLPTEAYACVHPGASVPERQWPPDQFASVVDRLHAAGLEVVLTGSQQEADVTAAVASTSRQRPRDLAGACTLGALAETLRGAALLVTNDTGVSHLAIAVGIPSVVVFTGSDPRRWAPLDAERHRAVAVATEPDDRRRRCFQDACLHLLPAPAPPQVLRGAVLTAVDAQLDQWS
jgi:ADP-heptose:LPS heptosyltransferase